MFRGWGLGFRVERATPQLDARAADCRALRNDIGNFLCSVFVRLMI